MCPAGEKVRRATPLPTWRTRWLRCLQFYEGRRKKKAMHTHQGACWQGTFHTVNGRNPAPPGMYKTLGINYQLVQDFNHQPYELHLVISAPFNSFGANILEKQAAKNCVDFRSLYCLVLPFQQKNTWATKNTRSYFPWNPGCLIGILIMVYYHPHLTV